MDLNLFENREKDNSSFIDKFLEELKNALKKFENKNQYVYQNMEMVVHMLYLK